MCFFITIAVPDQFTDQVRDHLRSGYGVSKADNRSLSGYLPDDHSMFYVTSGMCSCDLFQEPVDIRKSIDKIRSQYAKPKYRKRGWTKAKIERAVQDKIKTMKHGPGGLSLALRHKLSDIVRLTNSLFIVVHWYSGAIDEESISIKSESEIHAHDLINDDGAVTEDTWVALKP